MKTQMLSLLLNVSLLLVGFLWFTIIRRNIKINKISARMNKIIALSYTRRDATDP